MRISRQSCQSTNCVVQFALRIAFTPRLSMSLSSNNPQVSYRFTIYSYRLTIYHRILEHASIYRAPKMVQTLKAVNARELPSWQETTEIDAGNGDIGLTR